MMINVSFIVTIIRILYFVFNYVHLLDYVRLKKRLSVYITYIDILTISNIRN